MKEIQMLPLHLLSADCLSYSRFKTAPLSLRNRTFNEVRAFNFWRFSFSQQLPFFIWTSKNHDPEHMRRIFLIFSGSWDEYL